jgi:hypothetical protein
MFVILGQLDHDWAPSPTHSHRHTPHPLSYVPLPAPNFSPLTWLPPPPLSPTHS